MSFAHYRAMFLVAATLLLATACGGSTTVPSSAGTAGLDVRSAGSATPEDTTSILKKLTKDVVIGTTVDPTNGDTYPRSLAMAHLNYGKIKKGQLLVCNFADSSGNAGKGTTIEEIATAAGSKPTTFAQSSGIEGCDGAAVTSQDQVYGTGLTSKKMVWFNQKGQIKKTYTSPIGDPLTDSFGASPPGSLYAPFFIFVGDVGTGSIDNLSLGLYGTGNLLQAVTGFAVSSGTGSIPLGPAGLAYNIKKGTLYVTDGVTNTIVAITKAPNLLVKDEIIVKKGGKTFKCAHKTSTCANLVMSGSPLNAPEAATLLPNGNLVVANTAGGNTLVELTPAGKVLATKVVDKSSTPGVFALLAIGKTDSNTAIFYTDSNTNDVHELEQ
jgi:ribosomal protein S11